MKTFSVTCIYILKRISANLHDHNSLFQIVGNELTKDKCNTTNSFCKFSAHDLSGVKRKRKLSLSYRFRFA